MEKPNSQLFATKKRVYIRWERLVSDIGSEAEGLMAIIELNGKILDKGIRKKKNRMHEPCANLEFSAFAIRGKVTHAPKLSIVQAFDKKKKTRKKKIFTLSCYFWRFKYIRCNCHIIDSKNKEQQHSLHI